MNGTCIFFKNRAENDEYEKIFQLAGFKTVFVPILSSILINEKKLIEYLSSENFINKIECFIVTSQRTVSVLETCLKKLDDNIKREILKKKAYSVGPATSQSLLQIGFKYIYGGIDAGNAYKLAEMICKEVNNKKKITFFCGKIKKDIISTKLKQLNYEFDEVVVYETQERSDIFENFKNEIQKIKNYKNEDLQSLNNKNWMFFFSSQGLKTILDYIKKKENLKQYLIVKSFKIASIGKSTNDFLTKNNIIVHFTPQKPTPTFLLEGISK